MNLTNQNNQKMAFAMPETVQKNLNHDSSNLSTIEHVDAILCTALEKQATDVHIETYTNISRIRLRIDGILQTFLKPSTHLIKPIIARLKVMAQLDIAERRLPQDGHFKIKLEKKEDIDCRVSTCPTIHGEKIVIRLLNPTAYKLTMEKLGFHPVQQQLFVDTLKKPQGMVLVTGPTGSGKTITLYSGLNFLNNGQVNITTVEDPVELHLHGINQVNINPKAELTFATILRTFLRQDPDIIMVGEIRDLETAEISFNAAQTGHLVLSTLHSNSASETITRLLHLGLKAYAIATCVSLIIAQRLIRCLCSHCKQPIKIAKQKLINYGLRSDDQTNVQIYAPRGCEHCCHGYRNRTGIYEMLSITDQLSAAITQGKNSIDLLKIAKRNGMLTLQQAALLKVQQGITSLEEIKRFF